MKALTRGHTVFIPSLQRNKMSGHLLRIGWDMVARNFIAAEDFDLSPKKLLQVGYLAHHGAHYFNLKRLTYGAIFLDG